MVHPLKYDSGVSLIEISITILIITVTALVIMKFSRNTLTISKDARSSDAAFLSAEEKITELAVQPFPDASGTDTDTVDNIICMRSWSVKDTNTIRRATVTVTYKSLNGTSRTITLAGAIN